LDFFGSDEITGKRKVTSRRIELHSSGFNLRKSVKSADIRRFWQKNDDPQIGAEQAARSVDN
jgi:hypothetical protein